MRLYWVSWLLSLSWCLLRFTEKFVSALATGFSTACYRDYLEASNSRSTLACLGGSAKLIELHCRQIRPSGMLLVLFGLLCLLNIIVAWIDIRQGIIPDWLNLTIAGLGLSTALVIGGPWAGLEAAGEGAAIGVIFFLLRRLYFAFRKVQGLGLGDVKFLAAAGIWVGVAGLPILLLVATLTALICAGLMRLAGRRLTGQTSLSFGPFLAIGLLSTSGLQQHWLCCSAIN